MVSSSSTVPDKSYFQVFLFLFIQIHSRLNKGSKPVNCFFQYHSLVLNYFNYAHLVGRLKHCGHK